MIKTLKAWVVGRGLDPRPPIDQSGRQYQALADIYPVRDRASGVLIGYVRRDSYPSLRGGCEYHTWDGLGPDRVAIKGLHSAYQSDVAKMLHQRWVNIAGAARAAR